MYHIIILWTAKRDLYSIADYIRYNLKNASAANNVLSLINNEVNKLSIFPFANPVVYMSSNSIKYRVLKVKNYLIILTIDDQTVIITRIIYSKRDWKNLLD